MRYPALPLLLVLSGSVTNALKIPITRTRSKSSRPNGRRSGDVSVLRPVVNAAATSDSGELDLSTVHDLLYIANLTLGGTVYPVQLDTGSSDLWVHGESSPLPNSTPSTINTNCSYGIGYAAGPISFAEVEFAGISVPSQAFLDASDASNPALGYGADGILGLGFDTLSTVYVLLNRSGATNGSSFLYNVFAQDKTEPNFISFSLDSSLDAGDSIPGVFSIGELEPQYAAVQNSTAIPTFPPSAPSSI